MMGEPNMVRMSDAQRLAAAVLMFHESGPWTNAKRQAWYAITGRDDATTVTLCDLARRLLEREAA